MIQISDVRRGTNLELDGTLYTVVEVHHVKTKKSAVYRTKLRDLRAGHITERSFNAGEKVPDVRVERRSMQYLYAEDNALVFMNTESYDQIPIARRLIEDSIPYLKEGGTAQVVMFGEEALGIELPAAVELKIVDVERGVKGDTATGATKPATLETGLVVNVPLFVNQGDTIKVSTDTGTYIERVASR
ncbi:MAG: elongation factor P [Dehalococcoidia bacterium]|nr:elongation factor P [Dehalococcoidia bacterium]